MFQRGLTYLRKNRISVVLALVFICLGFFKIKHDNENWQRGVVNSDGRGYYYFLPAIAAWNFDYTEIQEQEIQAIGKPHQPYILKTEKGRQFNKCYPGVAIMQLPSYIVASGLDKLLGNKVNPYSNLHLYFFFWTTLLFLYLSLLYLRKVLALYFKNDKNTWLSAIVVVFGTNIAYQAFFNPGITHHYTFFCFVLWIFFLLKWKKTDSHKYLVYVAFCTGLMLLVRPTNALIILFLPFILGDIIGVKAFFRSIFSSGIVKMLQIILAGLIPLSLLPLITYSQTGQLFYWSYQGEGFRWEETHWLDTWISYRAGILWHTPLVAFGLIGLVSSWYKWKQQGAYLIGAYGILTFVLGAWWCWDYQLFFGHRGFTEYQLFTGFLIIIFLSNFRKSWIGYSFLAIPLAYAGIRTFQKITDIYSVQKFTSVTYWKSIVDFNTDEKDKYIYFTNCQPHGKVNVCIDLMKGLPDQAEMNDKMQFWPALGYDVPREFAKNRLFVTLNFNKKLKESDDWRDVVAVFVGKDEHDSIVHYAAYPIYHYVYEGKTDWVNHEISEEFILEQDNTKKVIVYLWDLGNKSYYVKDFNAELKVICN